MSDELCKCTELFLKKIVPRDVGEWRRFEKGAQRLPLGFKRHDLTGECLQMSKCWLWLRFSVESLKVIFSWQGSISNNSLWAYPSREVSGCHLLIEWKKKESLLEVWVRKPSVSVLLGWLSIFGSVKGINDCPCLHLPESASLMGHRCQCLQVEQAWEITDLKCAFN